MINFEIHRPLSFNGNVDLRLVSLLFSTVVQCCIQQLSVIFPRISLDINNFNKTVTYLCCYTVFNLYKTSINILYDNKIHCDVGVGNKKYKIFT